MRFLRKLLVIPGIAAGYSYAMTDYILAEHPGLTSDEVLVRSKKMMQGDRWLLFCLEFSWDIFCALTLSIGNLGLRPNRESARAAFYREISGTGYRTYCSDQ